MFISSRKAQIAPEMAFRVRGGHPQPSPYESGIGRVGCKTAPEASDEKPVAHAAGDSNHHPDNTADGRNHQDDELGYNEGDDVENQAMLSRRALGF
jgi:hypothetical protein